MARLLRNRRLLGMCILGLIVLQLILIGVHQYRYFFHSAYFDSDAAAEILLAEHMAKDGSWLISDTWFYSTEVRVFHNHLLMIPIFWFTNNYHIVAACGSMMMAALLAASMYFCVRGAKLSRLKALAAALVCVLPQGAGIRTSYYSLFIANAYYGFYMLCTLLWLGLYLRYTSAQEAKQMGLFGVLCALSMVLATTGVRYLLILGLPFLIFDIWERLRKEKRDKATPAIQWRSFAFSGTLAASWGVGFLLFKLWFSKAYDAGQTTIGYTSNFNNQLLNWLRHVISFGGYQHSNGNVLSVLGLVNFIQLVFGLAIVCAAVGLLFGLHKLEAPTQRYVMFAWSVFLVNSVVFLFTDHNSAARYIWVGMPLFLPMPLFYLKVLQKRPLAKTLALGLLAGLTVGTSLQLVDVHYPYQSGLVQSYAPDYYQRLTHTTYVDNRLGYLAFLRQSEYSFGWGNFWDAGVSTVLLNGNVHIAGTFDEQPFALFSWLMPHEYLDTAANPPQFYLLQAQVYADRVAANLPLYGQVVYEDAAYVVIEAESLPAGY